MYELVPQTPTQIYIIAGILFRLIYNFVTRIQSNSFEVQTSR